MTEKDPIPELIHRFYSDAWNRWSDEAVDELLAREFVFRGSLGDAAFGRDGFRAYRDKVRAAFPNFRSEVREIVVEGRRAVRLRCIGRHEGELFGIEPSRRLVEYEAAASFRCRDGHLTEAWVLGDLDGLRNQLSGQVSESA